MKRYSLWFGLIFVVFIFIFSPVTRANDIQLGGKLNVNLTGLYDSEMGFGLLPQANLDLELFLPVWNDHEIKCQGYFYTDAAEGKIDFFWKKLYWKHRWENLHLSVGRQPISWSFGSLLNPVDYTLGAVALDRDYSGKFQDAIEAYFPVNWNTSLSVVASLPDDSHTFKMGMRGRTLINHFDVTVNFVQEQIRTEETVRRRIGMTAKGDIGSFGVYGALGYYQEKRDSFSFLAGLDYSHFFQAGDRIYLQAEYLNIPPDLLSLITGSMMTSQKSEDNVNLLVSSVSYQIDEFSSIVLTYFGNFSDGSQLLMPSYSNQIAANTTLNIEAGVTLKQTQESESFFGKPSQFFVQIGAQYTF